MIEGAQTWGLRTRLISYTMMSFVTPRRHDGFVESMGTEGSSLVFVTEVSTKHLSLMEHACHDNVPRSIEIERDEMPRSAHRRLGCTWGTGSQVIGEIPLADVINGSDPDPSWVLPEILECLVQ